MLRPVPMVHLRVQVPARDASATTRAIARAGLLHLVDLAHGRAPANAPVSVELLTAFRELERRVREAARRLEHRFTEPAGKLQKSEVADFDLRAEGYNLIVHYNDQPGALGKIGTLLGGANVNILAAQLSQDVDGDSAIVMLRLDTDVPEDVRTAISAAVDATTLEVVDLS